MKRIAIIGTGVIAEMHLKAYLSFPEQCQVVALCDIFPEKARKLQACFHLEQALVYGNYDELLERSDIDLVSICTPPFSHAAAAIVCMQAGKHVLVEKPMAMSLAECDEMIAVQKKTGVYLGVVCQNRFSRDNQMLKALLDSGIPGKVLYGQVESFWYRGLNYYDVWWRGTWEKEGGGCVINHGVHQIDLLNWFMGPPETVTAVLTNAAHDNSEAEDMAAAILTYKSGAVVTLSVNLVTHGQYQKLVFQCENASLSSPYEVKCSKQADNGFPVDDRSNAAAIEQVRETASTSAWVGHEAQIRRILEFLENGDMHLEESVAGRLAIEVITAVYQSGFTQTTVHLPLDSGSPLYEKECLSESGKKYIRQQKSKEKSGGM